MTIDLPPLWPPQARGLEGIEDARDRGIKRALYTSPTGGGKSRVMVEVLKWRRPAVVYSNRRALTEQLARVLAAAGLSFGMRSAGYKPALLEDIQLSSIQTERERVYDSGQWSLHGAEIVLVDEAHSQGGPVAARIIQDHVEAGAFVLGFTATPLGLDHIYEELIEAGTLTELRHCGALVSAITYAPDEPGKLIKKTWDDEAQETIEEPVDPETLSNRKIAKAMPPVVLFGRVFDHWRQLNPQARPAIGFAPDVAGSLYFAEQFWAQGVPAAHIDGSDIWICGKWYNADPKAREHLRRLMESGEVKITWNRFVLREGIDWPFLYHGIFATAFGSLSSYLQAGGRLLRQYRVNGRPQLDHVIIQDHGGNYHRHGSLNSDREWGLEYDARIYSAIMRKRMREKTDPEPIVCRRCYAVRIWGRECFRCGFVQRTRSRIVLESDGKLREVKGDIYKPRRPADKTPAAVKAWESVFWRFYKAGLTFEAAVAFYALNHHWKWPQPDWPLMPTREGDWFRRVVDVPFDRLTTRPRERQQTAALEF